MKLYYLLISIFCIRLIGISYFITLLFFGNLFLHLLDRLPVFINRYPDIKFLKNINENYKYLVQKTAYNNSYDHIYYSFISSSIAIRLINIYNSAEYFYLIFIDETLLMFGNLAFKAANQLMSSRINDSQIKQINLKDQSINDNLLIDSSEDEDDELEISENISLLDKIKKQNNILDKDKFESMSLSDLNKMNTVLSTLTGSLNQLVTSIKVDKEKTI